MYNVLAKNYNDIKLILFGVILSHHMLPHMSVLDYGDVFIHPVFSVPLSKERGPPSQ